MKTWTFMAFAGAAAAAPAQADITAVYVADGPGMALEMKIEVAEGGNLRGDMNIPGVYLIRRDGRNYFIAATPTGPLVQDVEDVGAVMQEELSRMSPSPCDRIPEAKTSARLVPLGLATIAGRTGEAYGNPDRRQRPEVVISRDPALALLGAAMAAQFRASTTVMGQCLARVPMFAEMQALLDSGAPLQFGPMHLETVETGPIDPARFVLPAAPATREEIRVLMKHKSGPAVTIAPGPSGKR